MPYFNRYVQLKPTAAKYIFRSEIKSNRGDAYGTISDLDTAIALDPSNARAYSEREIAKLNIGDTTGGRMDYQKFIELDHKISADNDKRYVKESDYKKVSFTFSDLISFLKGDIGDIDQKTTEKNWFFVKRTSKDTLGFYVLKWALNETIEPGGSDTTASQWLNVTLRGSNTLSIDYQFKSRLEYNDIYKSLLSANLRKVYSKIDDENVIETKFIGKFYTYYLTRYTKTIDYFALQILKNR